MSEDYVVGVTAVVRVKMYLVISGARHPEDAKRQAKAYAEDTSAWHRNGAVRIDSQVDQVRAVDAREATRRDIAAAKRDADD